MRCINTPCAIFDLDGTLLDSMGVWAQIDVDFLKKRGIHVPQNYFEAIAHLNFRACADYTIARFNLRESPEAVMAEWHDMAVCAYRERVALRPTAYEYLIALKEKGVRLAVATGGQRELFEPALKRCGIYELFESITTLNEVSRGKGFPDIYLRAAEKLGVSPGECTVFEDIYEAVCGAKAGGFYTVAVFEENSRASWEKIKAAADMYIRSYAELM